MGVAIHLIGRHDGGQGFLGTVEDWLRQECKDTWMAGGSVTDADGRPALQVVLHPTAEAVELVAWDPRTLVVSAKTSSVGPGYHIYLCELLQRLGGATEIKWDPPDAERASGDDTGFFHSGDRGAVAGAMLEWLQSSAKRALEILDRGYDGLGLSMPADSQFQHEMAISTVMGPRDRAWLERVAEDPGAGIDVFPWWDEGLGATYLLGRATCQMWTDVRWREPMSPDEKTLLKQVIRLLGQAYRLDPSLPYPTREWKEILGLLGIEDPSVDEAEQRSPVAEDAPRIGFRRLPVRAQLSEEWTITVPGSFATRYEEDGRWTAFEAGRSVSVACQASRAHDGSAAPVEEMLQGIRDLEGEPLDFRGERAVGVARVAPSAEGEGWVLTGASAVPGSVAMCSIAFRDEARRPWAVATWQSLDHPAGEGA